MKKIDLILAKNTNKRKIEITKLGRQRIISHGIFYEINIKLKKDNEICIYSKWNLGILGQFIFKNILEEKNTLYEGIKNELLECDFLLNEVNLRF